MKNLWLSVFLLSLLCSLISNGQELPPIQIYSPETYDAGNQNWAISQSDEKFIYVANNKGLLEFNGAHWQLYASPNETIIRSVSVIDNKIYTGSYREFGYWQKNELGVLIYSSLSQKLKIPFLDDEEIWNIMPIDDWVLFQSLKRIYIYNKQNFTFKFIESQTTITKVFKLNEGIYFQKAKNGIYKIENGKSKLVSNDAILQNNLLVNIFNHNNKLLVETQDNGFYYLENGILKKWNILANKTLSKVSVYNSIKLKDNSFVLGTISNGILHLTANGEINYDINSTDGLSNNTVLSLFEDIENNIWLGLDNGINCINIKSPFRVYNDKDGNIGTVYASAIYENNLYLGTNQGLFFRPLEGNTGFKFIQGTQGQVWCLVEIDNTLFCGHNSGTFIVKKDKANKAIDVLGTWNIKPLNSNTLIQGNYNGLNIIEKKNGIWSHKNKIEGFDISSKYFEIVDNNTIFVNHEYRGVFKLKVNNDLTHVLNFQKDTLLEKGLNSSLIKHNGDLLYAYKKGVFKYNFIDNIFKKDSLLSNVFNTNEYTSGKLVSDIKSNKLWSFSAKGLSYISAGKLSNKPEINKIPFPIGLRNDVTGYENITFLKDQKYLLGTSLGYFIIGLDKIVEPSYQVNINMITNNNYKNGDVFKLVNKTISGDFKNTENNIQFSYSTPEYNKYLEVEYQYQLIGIYDNWSDWSKKSNELFENLPYGNYTFNVKARIGSKLSSNIESYNFKIARPWYISNIMIVVYILLLSLFSLIMHNAYKRHYKKQQEKLLKETTKELELKELENKQQLMQFNNENLRQDIENKNRELSISTMSLIKKNEFLNSIKKELGKVDNMQNLKHVSKIIDKNLNHTDDWNLFQEAFNNADKNFLKTVKEKHPLLTHNDLRLCTYLRLNLSSKEIAPLLNISSRSVEVKRYRLRKKMNLSPNSSLTNYILEI